MFKFFGRFGRANSAAPGPALDTAAPAESKAYSDNQVLAIETNVPIPPKRGVGRPKKLRAGVPEAVCSIGDVTYISSPKIKIEAPKKERPKHSHLAILRDLKEGQNVFVSIEDAGLRDDPRDAKTVLVSRISSYINLSMHEIRKNWQINVLYQNDGCFAGCVVTKKILSGEELEKYKNFKHMQARLSRARALSPERRQEIAKNASLARWHNQK